MSGHVCKTLNLGTPDELLERAGSGNVFPARARDLLRQYRQIGNAPDAMFQRSCAQLAFDILCFTRSEIARCLQLTEWGVTMRPGSNGRVLSKENVWQTWDGDWGEYNQWTAAPYAEANAREVALATSEAVKGTVELLADLNIEFLVDWQKIMEEKAAKRKKLLENNRETRRELAETVDKNAELMQTPGAIAKALEADGFTVTNKQKLEDTPPSVAMSEGTRIEAANGAGETRTVIIDPKGNLRTEVHVPGAPEKVCMAKARAFAEQIAKVVEMLAASCGAPVSFMTKNQGKDPEDSPAPHKLPGAAPTGLRAFAQQRGPTRAALKR
ncbi:MAG: hypothetical protein WCT53_04870 [Candidatus Gracilibacteria bacterium]